MDQLFLEDGHSIKKLCRSSMPTDNIVLLQLANSLEFLHTKQLVHGDIRPENVAICSSSNSTVSVKWAGFGLLKAADEYGRYNLGSEVRGTLKWMAPEVLEHLQKGSEHSNQPVAKMRVESDVFPAGYLFFYYLTGVHPFGT